MVLVLLFCTILIIAISLFFLIIFSTLKIEIKNFKTSNLTTNKEKSTFTNSKKYSKYEVNTALEILNKLKYFSLNLNSRKIKKITLKMHLDKTKIKELEREISISDIKEVMNIKPKISYMDLKLKLGIDDVLLTTYSVPIISTLISILLPYTVENKDVNNIKYELSLLGSSYFCTYYRNAVLSEIAELYNINIPCNYGFVGIAHHFASYKPFAFKRSKTSGNCFVCEIKPVSEAFI